MKLTKTKKVETITEEIEILPGFYYFGRRFKFEEVYEYFKVVILKSDANYADFTVSKIRDVYEDYLISYRKDYSDYFGSVVECYFRQEEFLEDEELVNITEEEFEAAKERVKNKL